MALERKTATMDFYQEDVRVDGAALHRDDRQRFHRQNDQEAREHKKKTGDAVGACAAEA